MTTTKVFKVIVIRAMGEICSWLVRKIREIQYYFNAFVLNFEINFTHFSNVFTNDSIQFAGVVKNQNNVELIKLSIRNVSTYFMPFFLFLHPLKILMKCMVFRRFQGVQKETSSKKSVNRVQTDRENLENSRDQQIPQGNQRKPGKLREFCLRAIILILLKWQLGLAVSSPLSLTTFLYLF